MQFTPVLQFRSRSVVAYNQFERTGRSILQQLSSKKLSEYETYTGRLCPGAKKRLTKAIEALVQTCREVKCFHFVNPKDGKAVSGKYTLTFVTFTIHSPKKNIIGRDAHKQVLEPMLRWLREDWGMDRYVWKAELQKRGQLHYHLTCNVAVPWWELRDKWNGLQARAGLLDDYYAEHGDYDANSTDVHSVYKVNDMAGYLKKSIFKSQSKNASVIAEMKKELQNDKSIGGKVWDCSLEIKQFDYFKVFDADVVAGERRVSDPAFGQLMVDIESNCERLSITDNCTVYYFAQPTWRLLEDDIKKDYFEHLEKDLGYERVTLKKKPAPAPAPPDWDTWVPVKQRPRPLTLFSDS